LSSPRRRAPPTFHCATAGERAADHMTGAEIASKTIPMSNFLRLEWLQ
jgi:hypothetical protein